MMMKKAGDDDDRDVTLDECGVFFPLLSLHDGTVQPTILSTYFDVLMMMTMTIKVWKKEKTQRTTGRGGVYLETKSGEWWSARMLENFGEILTQSQSRF